MFLVNFAVKSCQNDGTAMCIFRMFDNCKHMLRREPILLVTRFNAIFLCKNARNLLVTVICM